MFTDNIDDLLEFYTDIVGLIVVVDIVTESCGRVVVLLKEDNIGIQFHIYQKTEESPNSQFSIELSISTKDYEDFRNRIQISRYGVSNLGYDHPLVSGARLIDPIGNELTLVWRGDCLHDEKEGWDSEFLDYRNTDKKQKHSTDELDYPDKGN